MSAERRTVVASRTDDGRGGSDGGARQDAAGPARRFGVDAAGAPVTAWEIGSDALAVTVLDHGATLNRIRLRDEGTPGEGWTDVALGFADMGGYLAHPEVYLGGLIGRYANRIAGAAFDLDGRRHRLEADDGGNTLHGGSTGLDRRTWAVTEQSPTALTLAVTSPDGDGGFPGRLDVRARYTIEGTALELALEARTDAPTVVGLTSHVYFNLAGGGSIDGHLLRVPADRVLMVDATGIPGEVADVAAAGLDLRAGVSLGQARRRPVPQVAAVGGLDHPYLPDPPVDRAGVGGSGDGLREVADLSLPGTGRGVRVLADQPCLQVYTGNVLATGVPGHGGALYRPGDGVALEPQPCPDAPNRPDLPSAVLRPGAVWRARIRWEFRTSR
ncbi:aldose 1-epimerase [Tersicoccus solisilvae]|uniref:Aldose 1-epimerase n=1 Tax=Tersicoccus solisilvae TaxID=1882339 RepID=A0ABQ1P0F6_9MICC|nr:aldose epimerase family protein [Tersicoccus solisilvae]GGC88705.1 aldose 1-epimerase [Tersicoccus solisilvae]